MFQTKVIDLNEILMLFHVQFFLLGAV